MYPPGNQPDSTFPYQIVIAYGIDQQIIKWKDASQSKYNEKRIIKYVKDYIPYPDTVSWS